MKPRTRVINLVNSLEGSRFAESKRGVPMALIENKSISWMGRSNLYRVFDRLDSGEVRRYDCSRIVDVIDCLVRLSQGREAYSINRAFLANQFSSEKAIGITYGLEGSDDEGVSRLADGSEFGVCTHCAHWVVNHLGQGDVYGFLTDDNQVDHEEIQSTGGHDFAVIQGRYIVDLWISHFTGCLDQVIFDLLDPEDALTIHSVYGDPRKWSILIRDRQGAGDHFIKPGEDGYPSEKRLTHKPVVPRSAPRNEHDCQLQP